MRTGRRLGIDVGKARIGLAISDIDGLLAVPLATVERRPELTDTVSLISQALDGIEPIEVYVGLPLSLSGGHTPSTLDAVGVGLAVGTQLGFSVRLIDERLTTVSAASNLRASGKNAKSSRQIIDQEAARLILEQALQIERSSQSLPGTAIDDWERE